MHRPRFFSGEANERGIKDIVWHGTVPDSPAWGGPTARALAFLGGFGGEPDLHVMMNLYWEPFDFQAPSVPGRHWGRVIDTFRPSPQDILEPGREQPITGDRYRAEGRSIVVLMSQEPSTPWTLQERISLADPPCK